MASLPPGSNSDGDDRTSKDNLRALLCESFCAAGPRYTSLGLEFQAVPSLDSKGGSHRNHRVGRNYRPGGISDRKAGIALNDLLA
jgi:hypothetical protein